MQVQLPLILICFINLANSIGFTMKRNEKRCFYKQIREGLLTGKYSVKWKPNKQGNWTLTPEGFGLHVEIGTKDKKSILSRTYGNEGKFSFYKPEDHTSNQFHICLSSRNLPVLPNRNVNLLKYELKLKQTSLEFEELLEKENNEIKEKLSVEEEQARSLKYMARTISKTQELRRAFDQEFRQACWHLGKRMVRWGIVQVIFLFCSGVFQIWFMRKFFIKHKIH